MVEVSIIIPTRNEEIALSRLLNSLQSQSYKDYEVIIADYQSKDNTVKTAKKYKCKIVKGGLPSKGRNNGAKAAKGNLLLFMDADAILEKGSLKRLLEEFMERNLDCGSALLKPLEGMPIDYVLHWLWNGWAFLTQWFYPHGTGAFILCKKDVFEKVHGFDEGIKVGEDHNFVMKVKDYEYKYRILNKSFVRISVRRFEAEGRLKVVGKIISMGFYRTFIGEVRKDYFDYNFEYRKKTP